MKTTVIDVRDLLSPLSARGVEKQLAKMPGVQQAEVNLVSGSATVLYEETVTGLDAIKAKVHEGLCSAVNPHRLGGLFNAAALLNRMPFIARSPVRP